MGKSFGEQSVERPGASSQVAAAQSCASREYTVVEHGPGPKNDRAAKHGRFSSQSCDQKKGLTYLFKLFLKQPNSGQLATGIKSNSGICDLQPFI